VEGDAAGAATTVGLGVGVARVGLGVGEATGATVGTGDAEADGVAVAVGLAVAVAVAVGFAVGVAVAVGTAPVPADPQLASRMVTLVLALELWTVTLRPAPARSTVTCAKPAFLTGVVSAGRAVHREVAVEPEHTEILLGRHDSCPATTSLAWVADVGTGSDTVTLCPGFSTRWSSSRTSTVCHVVGAAADVCACSAEATTVSAATRSTTRAVRVMRMRRGMGYGSLDRRHGVTGGGLRGA